MAYCRFCGAALPEGARFCYLCGEKVDDAPRCPACGAALPEGSRFCTVCGAPLTGAAPAQPAAPARQGAHPGRPPEIPLGGGRTIRIPAPEIVPEPERGPVPAPDSAPIAGVRVSAVVNSRAFSGSVQRFFGDDGSFYTFHGPGMYGFLEPFSMNYNDGQGPIEKSGGSWYYHSAPTAEGTEVPALAGAQILTSAPEGMYVYIAPTIHFVSPDGAVRPFMDAAETLTDMVCYKNWLFVTYLGPFEEMPLESGGTMCCDRSYVVVYDRADGGVAAILERCAGVYYIDQEIIILCDLRDNGEISRNVYKRPVHGWTEQGFRTLANYVGRIRGSIPFSRLLFESCGGRGHWKTPSECTANLRCCDWKQKRLGYQKKGALLWRAFDGAPLSSGDGL